MSRTANRRYYFQVFNIAADSCFKISGRRWLQLILSEELRVLATVTVGTYDDEAVAVRRVHQNEKFVFVRSPDGTSYIRIEGLPPKSRIPTREVPWFYVAFGVLRNSLSAKFLGARVSIAARLLLKGRYGEIWRRLTRQPRIQPDPIRADSRGKAAATRAGQLPIRAALFTHSLSLEGAPISLLELAGALSDKSVIAPIVIASSDGPLAREFIDRGIEVIHHPLPLDRVLTASDYSNAVGDLARMLAGHKIEFVLANTLRQFHAISAAAVAGVPSMWIVRETEPWRGYFDYLSAEVAPKAVACFGSAHRIVFVSDATRNNWAPLLTGDNSEVIPNALDPARFDADGDSRLGAAFRRRHGIGEDDIVLLNVGRVCALKGQADIAGAFAKLDATRANRLQLVLVGDCDSAYRGKLENTFTRAGLSDRVTWVGVTDTPVAAYRAADIYVCSSRTESYPRAILEAMSAGLAIVTTPVGGIAEQVVADESALFYDPGDDGALARCLSTLVDSPSARTELASGALRAHGAMQAFDVMTSRYADVIQGLFRGEANRRR